MVVLNVCQLSRTFELRRATVLAMSNSKIRKDQAVQNESQQQVQMPSHEYENLSQSEKREIEDNKHANNDETIKQSVLPSTETNGNSQVVFVNLARVINEQVGNNSKNNPTRLVGTQIELVKQAGQIACGETNPNGKPSMNNSGSDPIPNRIVGGTKAEPGEFPYQVRLNIRSRRGSSLCGGVIIDQRHILTAAHCMTTW